MLLLAAGCLLAATLLQSCARKESSASPASQVVRPVPAVLPPDLAEMLKKSGFAVAEKPISPEDFSLASLDGTRQSLASFKGKIVLLSFWATWCGPCKEELPSVQALYKKLSDKGFVVVAVDIGEEKTKVAQFVKEHNLTFPVLLDGDVAVGSAFGASSIPTNYLLDRSGRIFARIIGFDGTDWTSSQRLDLFDKILDM
ncbi:MAG: TlpA disulfide reductase family protein [Spirochaetia bacterium]